MFPHLSMQSPEAVSLESSRSSPPPDFLLDDDPFANHTGARPLPLHRSTPTSPTHSRQTSVKQPRSPLGTEPRALASLPESPSTPVPIPCSRSASSPCRPSPPSPLLSGRQVRPAYTRPAFAPRPSLPSLHSLAQSDFVYPIKVRHPASHLDDLVGDSHAPSLGTKGHARSTPSPRALGRWRGTGTGTGKPV
jgi:hypothetical protein